MLATTCFRACSTRIISKSPLAPLSTMALAAA